MILPGNIDLLAAQAFERLVYCAIAGTSLVAIVSAVLVVLPRRNSQTRFAIWFSALVAVATLPFASLIPLRWISNSIPAWRHAVLTLPASWAEYVVVAWAALAATGVMRVAFGLLHLRRLRRRSIELDEQILSPEIRNLIASRRGSRLVALLVSSEVEVPTAIGFFRPAILLPAWLMADHQDGALDASANERLKYILLHELAHLRRWDDWSNLVLQLAKSVLFFHPGVLWIERKLVLDREMACDDAVLAEAESPHRYAQCLAQVAEKSFLRRHIALAQAAVSRVKQLSRRVAWILDHDRSHSTRIWKPAIPLVAAVAVFCAVSASNTTELIGFSDSVSLSAQPHTAGQTRKSEAANTSAVSNEPQSIPAGMKVSPDARALPADLKYRSAQRSSLRVRRLSMAATRTKQIQRAPAMAENRMANAGQAHLMMSSYAPTDGEPTDAPTVVLVVVTGRSVSMSNQDPSWQISSFELYLYLPAYTRQIPRKT